jgi:hypothetical protein
MTYSTSAMWRETGSRCGNLADAIVLPSFARKQQGHVPGEVVPG